MIKVDVGSIPLPELLSAKRMLRIGDLRPADSPRMNGEDVDHARTLAELDVTLPAIIVHEPTMRVIDGMHRLAAARARGEEFIAARLFHGSIEDAFVLAVRCNGSHGLPLSLSDRVAAAERIIVSYPQWSDRRIARTAGLSPTTVGALRRRSNVHSGQLNSRIGADGKARPPGVALARQRASELILLRPDASLREIAREVGIAPNTVRDVRKRMAHGDSVLPSRRQAVVKPGDRAAPGMAGDLDRAGGLDQLMKDPALRFTESGRLLLRILQSCAIEAGRWVKLAECVPSHQRHRVVFLIRDYADRLAELADGLDREGPRVAR
ncbi:ParB/RepB/Spo0J family partition protein [Amycolatopsis keratiniphila]|uniref:ParB-like N-terminal domain-containing protein n=1 Tax=Amycolatopsis keratiniphila subsp. keratiniphila TaxID=227715 RepID=A0A1W2LSN6_9PSEU|nr:ParB/RepB/Spo0J family partition protein [Amycolatopsis keratiniphila]ONF67870.1 hypothetical protein AVR91_0220705 [Amycolatopsis keratiniphila subsp. keratiniphila]